MSPNTVLESAPDAIVVADERGRIDAFNRAAAAMFGYDAADVIGSDVRRLFDIGDAVTALERDWPNLGGPAANGTARAFDVRLRRANGEVFPASLSIGAADADSVRRFIAIFRDASEHVARARRIGALETRVAALSRLLLASELAAGIAHEINQPLGAVATYAQAGKRLIARGAPDMGLLDEICRNLDEQARRASDVVRRLRETIPRPAPQVELLLVNELVADALSMIGSEADAARIDVEAEYGRSLPPVHGDEPQLHGVLGALLRNAIEALREMPPGVRRLSVGTSVDDDGCVCVTVADSGPGVAAALAERLFEPFATGRPARLGLGLAICRAVVESHGGSLRYESRPAGGSVFRLELPGARTPAATLQ